MVFVKGQEQAELLNKTILDYFSKKQTKRNTQSSMRHIKSSIQHAVWKESVP